MDSNESESKEQKRSRTGCQNCRVKRKKCDETRPTCQRCSRTGTECRWPNTVRFRYEHMKVPIEEHDRPIRQLSRTTNSLASIMNDAPAHPYTRPKQSHQSSPSMGSTTSRSIEQDSNLAPEVLTAESRNDFLLGQPLVSPAIDFRKVDDTPTDMFSDDGIFVPGSTYQELHKALRSQIFHTTQLRPISQSTSNATSNDVSASRSMSSEDAIGTSTPPELSLEQEVMLWHNWINEIAPWLDMFDHGQHHRRTLPVMAQTTSHLKYAMMALSARQIERKTGTIPASTSLSLYQWAIHLILPVMHSKTLSIFASCVILCVFEMSSCSPLAWRRHLDGCASLIMDMGISASDGGLEQSLFWCFARMDVCGALISGEQTTIPIQRWYVSEVEASIPSTTRSFEEIATIATFLLAQVLTLIHPPRATSVQHQDIVIEGNQFQDHWIRLFESLKLWHETLPVEMRPIFSGASGMNGGQNPFPTMIYSSGAAISSNQLYHTAMFLLLQKKPSNVRVESRSILWHARQICGISMSNNHHGAWINAVQPLWIAGQLMSHPSEHQSISSLYHRIERETGWAATWRAKDLHQHWGDLS